MPQELGLTSTTMFPSDVWMQVKMATFLCVLTADGSYFVCMNIHEYPRKQFRPCLLAEVRQLCLLVDVCGGAVLYCVCRATQRSSIVGGTPNPVFVADPLEYVSVNHDSFQSSLSV